MADQDSAGKQGSGTGETETLKAQAATGGGRTAARPSGA